MMVKVSYGYNEPEEATTEILGTYESWDEAAAAAEDKFDAIKERLADPETCYGEIEACRDNYYVTYGYYDPNLGRVVADRYYYVSIIERHPTHILAAWLQTAATTSV